VIASSLKDTNADDRAQTRADIARLLRRYDDAALPQEFIRLFRPGVDPAAWQGSTRQWLARVDELLGA
jgi:contact-dependent growth inhibition (CDI) system CdiI-like immunity protein